MKTFIKNHRYHLILWLLLLLISAASAGYLRASQKTALIKYQSKSTTGDNFQNKTAINKTSKPAILTTTQKQIANQPTSSARTATSTPKQAPLKNAITVTLYVNEQKYELNPPASSTVYQAMNLLSQQTNFTFGGKQYANLGFFVDEINGMKNNPKTNKYWIYYVNGQSANVGVSSYIIRPNDIITWKYEASKF